MIRTIRWFLYFAFSLLTSLPSLNRVKKLESAEQITERDELVDKTVKSWSRKLVGLSGAKITVVGEENIPDGAVLFVSNHQGNFDIPILLGYIGKPKGFIAKIETQKLYIVRDWMKYINCIFMDRNDIRQSVKAIGEGVKNLKSGKSMVIFPEGTRSDDGNLLEFKPGSMKLATKSGVPIVPVTISGSMDIMLKKSIIIRPANVEIVISKPIMPDAEIDTVDLTEMVKAQIEKNLKLAYNK